MTSTDDSVCIHTVYDAIEAELIRGRLAAEGIATVLQSDDAGGTLGYLTATRGIGIRVSRADEEKAYRILHEENPL